MGEQRDKLPNVGNLQGAYRVGRGEDLAGLSDIVRFGRLAISDVIAETSPGE